MPDLDYATIAYLLLLLTALGGWLIAQIRMKPGQTAQYAVVWGLIFIAVIAVAGLWDDIRRSTLNEASVNPDGSIQIPMAADGHYYLNLKVNGQPVHFLIDTGASQIVFTKADARKIGIDPESLDYIFSAQTANGTVRTAPITLGSIALDEFISLDVKAVVNDGDLNKSLLGMAYLRRFNTVTISNGSLILTR